MTRTLSRYRPLIALAVLSSAAVSAELARMVGFGMV